MFEILVFYSLIFIAGTLVGSFLNICIDRFPFDKSIISPPSHCPHCKHRLNVLDLVPIFSFFYIRGRCRYCKSKISWFYPLIEIFSGAMFALTVFVAAGSSMTFFFQELALIIYLLFIVSILIIVFFIDLKYGIIPFKLVVFSLIIITARYFYLSLADHTYIFNYLLSGVSVFLIFLLLFLATRGRAIGFGDVVFSLLMGYILGFPGIVLGIYIAFLTGALVSLILVLINKKRLKGGTIPFGPFLTLGTIISLFWGQYIISKLLWYLRL